MALMRILDILSEAFGDNADGKSKGEFKTNLENVKSTPKRRKNRPNGFNLDTFKYENNDAGGDSRMAWLKDNEDTSKLTDNDESLIRSGRSNTNKSASNHFINKTDGTTKEFDKMVNALVSSVKSMSHNDDETDAEYKTRVANQLGSNAAAMKSSAYPTVNRGNAVASAIKKVGAKRTGQKKVGAAASGSAHKLATDAQMATHDVDRAAATASIKATRSKIDNKNNTAGYNADERRAQTVRANAAKDTRTTAQKATDVHDDAIKSNSERAKNRSAESISDAKKQLNQEQDNLKSLNADRTKTTRVKDTERALIKTRIAKLRKTIKGK